MNINDLHKILIKAWNKETCYEPQQEQWSLNNPALGQCYITALIVNDYFGGEIIKGKLSNGINHYWNLIDGKEIDLTKSQFNEEPNISFRKIFSRNQLTENYRYTLLKKKISELT